ncbi:hypothetical protein FQA47_011008 [Oryzias melastigma]|uniref:Immunoglobulin subtype domain-containing protein n=1 Tax=Oryzias melastigma TaxID=30732 RepID=A0A834BWB9_ORYME|nr:hypothetical protein FQA47_011008 [Oryzias melastigma]
MPLLSELVTLLFVQQASSYNMQSTLCLRILGCSLLLTIFPVTEVKGMQEFSKPVGGNVTFQCPVDKNRGLQFVYVQRGKEFVNGFHSTRDLLEKRNNTKFENFTFSMYHLELTQSGVYECIIMYHGDVHEKLEYNLTVTVPYRKPSFTTECNNKKDVTSCQVTCTSQDGFPSKKFEIVSAQGGNNDGGMVTSRNDSLFNLTTKLFSSTVTVEFNCSKKEVKFVCSVAGVTSDTITVCTPRSDLHIYIISGVLVLVLVLATASVIIFRRCSGVKSDNGPATNAQEGVTLNQQAESQEESVV